MRRPSRLLAATGWSWSLMVQHLKRLRGRTRRPSCCMIRITRVGLRELDVDAKATVGPAVPLVCLPDQHGKPLVLNRSRRRRLAHRGVIASRRYTQG